MRWTFLWYIGPFIIIFFVWGCGSEGPASPDDGQVVENPSYRQDIQPIFNRSCIVSACHNAESTAAGLELTSYSKIMAGSDGGTFRVVIPGNAQDSELIKRLEGRSDRLSRQRMPLGGPYLSQSEVQTLRNWVDKGAQNN